MHYSPFLYFDHILINFQVDVANYDEIIALKEKIRTDLGEVEILINNAGVLPRVSLLEGKPEDIARIIDVNLVSYFWVSFDLFECFTTMCTLHTPDSI